ncbi:MAG: HAD family hydrolase [Gammaproteobacteria bacterium]|nr:HAD family hydrolase [Gammaproteobacteria bacterium]
MGNNCVITFDLDNTLWDVGVVIRKAEQQMRSWLDVEAPEYSERFDQTAIFELRSQLVAANPQLRHDLSALREEILFAAISQCGYKPAVARSLASTAFQKFFEARHDVVYFKGALEVLADLAGNYRLGALTNGNADVTKLGLDRYFSFAYSAADVGASKPAPAMFHAALEHCGAHPRESIHIGDHLIDDVQGAAAVGMHTIWVNHNAEALPADSQTPTGTVQNLQELPECVTEIFNG